LFLARYLRRCAVDALLRQDVSNRPLHVLHELGLLNAQLGLDSIAAAQINDRLHTLANVLVRIHVSHHRVLAVVRVESLTLQPVF
jgi:hypothetical protein